MTRQYFASRLADYEIEALKNMSHDLIEAYSGKTKVFAFLLIDLLFFERLESEEDVALHNKIIGMLYDMGIFHEGKEVEIAQKLIELADIPDEYKREDIL